MTDLNAVSHLRHTILCLCPQLPDLHMCPHRPTQVMRHELLPIFPFPIPLSLFSASTPTLLPSPS